MSLSHPRSRIAVTGMGAMSPLGLTLAESWRACIGGVCAIERRTFSSGETGPADLTMPVALVPGDPVAHIEQSLGRKVGGSLDPFALYALAAAYEAITAACLEKSQIEGAAIVFGHGIGGIHTLEQGYERMFGRRSLRVHPLTVPRVMASAPVSAIAMEFGIKGPVFAVASACSSSGHAIAQGALLIKSGLADIAIVGGSEAIASHGSLAAWDGLRAVSPTTCRPFSAGRDGMAIGEGGAALVLESVEHAQKRGATILAELSGTGMSSDAHHWTQPSLDGAVASMRKACVEAGVLEEDGILISAHGTGTPINDPNEARAINALFGARASSHSTIATKSSHGHLIGASPALQAVLGLCAVRDAVAPPILNYLGPDPECDLNLVINELRHIETRTLLVNSFAFGGLNTTLVFRSYSNAQ